VDFQSIGFSSTTSTSYKLQQVYIVLNTTLLAFAAERRAQAHMLLSTGFCSMAPASIDIACPQIPQQQTRRPPLLLSINGTDGRTDA